MTHRYALVFAPLITAVLAYAFSPWVARWAVRIGAVDLPDPRKIHRHAMPRLGGLAVILAGAVTLGIAPFIGGEAWTVPSPVALAVLLGLIPIVFVSILDDIRPVPARVKFLCHLIGSAIAVSAGVSLPEQIHVLSFQVPIGVLAVPLSVLWFTGVTNAFNIIDGLDGLAAGLAFISALAVGAVLITAGQLSSALLPLTLAGALAGFLPYNMYPARMFLGDTGSTAIGFTLAVVALKGGNTIPAGFAAATPVLILGLPIADTIVAIARRMVRRLESQSGGLFQPDSNHVHHRLLALGLHHRRAVQVLYGFGVVTAAVAYISMFLTSRESALLLLALLIAAAVGLKRLGYDEFALLRRGTILRFYEAPVLRASMFAVFVDILFVCVSVYVAVGLKTDDWLLRTHRPMAMTTALALVPLSVVVFWRARLYEDSWRVATIGDFVRAAQACWVVVFLALVVYSWQLETIPASLLVVYGLTNSFLMVCSRSSYRVLVSAQRVAGRVGPAVLIYGPEPEEFLQARDLIDRAGSFGLRPVGFVIGSGRQSGRLLAGLKIYGSIDDLPELVKASGAEAVVLARREVSSEAVGEFEDLCRLAAAVPYRLNTELQLLQGHETAEGLSSSHLIELSEAAKRLRDSTASPGWPTYQPRDPRLVRDHDKPRRRRSDLVVRPAPGGQDATPPIEGMSLS